MPRLVLTPHSRLWFSSDTGLPVEWPEADVAALGAAFQNSTAAGLVALASRRGNRSAWAADFSFWRDFADAGLFAFSKRQGNEDATLARGRAIELVLQIPGTPGAEYATPDLFQKLWSELAVHCVQAAGADPAKWLRQVNPAWHVLGKVTLHLAEHKQNTERPFAFMATYTHRLSAAEKPVHLPLSKALQEYAGAKDKQALKSLLEPLQRAGERSKWLADQVSSSRVFQPQAWSPREAWQFLRETPVFEEAGLAVRLPDWWRKRSGSGVNVSVTVGGTEPSRLGLGAMLDFQASATLDGIQLSPEEWQEIMDAQTGLVSLRGNWVEVDKEKLQEALEHWKAVQAQHKDGIGIIEGMRLLAGTRIGKNESVLPADGWTHVSAGTWLAEVLEELRAPQERPTDWSRLQATLRPYQAKGVAWLASMTQLRLGACLADDMGLGKTLQVIALLLQEKLGRKMAEATAPSLLVAPASLLENWCQEIRKFAPDLHFTVLHPSAIPAAEMKDAAAMAARRAGMDLVLTTYSMALRVEWMAKQKWDLLILDEAQAIKNPGSKQTHAVKRLPSRSRVALTGTPVENNLGDLWSLYDFLNPGLLGTSTEFSKYIKTLSNGEHTDYSPLRKLIQPYLLRRMKTDKSIIADLPDKTEVASWCLLSTKQAALYQQHVEMLKEQLEKVDGIQRRGLVLSSLMKFKQICNHPSQWLRDDDYAGEDSGKFDRLAELCEEIVSRQEKLLVFTQFQEMTEPLSAFLRAIFGRPGLVLHGGTPVKERQGLVRQFQTDDGPPFFVLSLKAGGTGLTLTNASHVIHFDRWWNPAVENQATDRAFRIGQKKNVMVHKFVCRGTIEERIHSLLADKAAVANSVIDDKGGAGKMLMDMSNEDLLRFVSLDLSTASQS